VCSSRERLRFRQAGREEGEKIERSVSRNVEQLEERKKITIAGGPFGRKKKTKGRKTPGADSKIRKQDPRGHAKALVSESKSRRRIRSNWSAYRGKIKKRLVGNDRDKRGPAAAQ